MVKADRDDWEAEARYCYDEARYYTWPLWGELPQQVRAWWIAAVRGAASLGSGKVNRRRVGPGGKNARDGSTAPPAPVAATPERYQAGSEPDPAGVLAAALGVPAT